VVPTAARSGDVVLQFKELKVASSRDFVLESRSQVEHQIRQGWLSVPSRLPCSEGEPMDEVKVDGITSTDAVLPPGQHKVRARFSNRYSELDSDLVLDFRLADGACLRTPVISQSIPLEVPNRPQLSISSDLVGNSDLRGLREILAFQVGMATWVDRFLLGGEAGVGFTMCNEGTCGRDEKKQLNSGLTFPVQAHVSYRLLERSDGRIFESFLLGLRYSFFPLNLPTLEGDRRFSAHGGYVTFAWAFTDPMPGLLVHQERRHLYEVIVPLGVLWEPRSNKTVFTGGMAVRFLLPL
jgi:hypothetical protein